MQPHPFAPTGLLMVTLRLGVFAGGTQGTEMTLSPAAPTQVRGWPGYPRCDPGSGFKGGLGDTYATSLYTIPEYEGTRQRYRDTVAEQTRCEKLGVRHVTPWLWIGGAPTHLLAAWRPSSSLSCLLSRRLSLSRRRVSARGGERAARRRERRHAVGLLARLLLDDRAGARRSLLLLQARSLRAVGPRARRRPLPQHVRASPQRPPAAAWPG